MKKIRYLCLFAAAVLVLNLFSASVKATEAGETTEQSGNIQYTQTTVLGSSQLINNAKAVALYECTTDTFMYAWNADTMMYPSSMVKIITANLAIQKGNLSDAVTVKKSVLDTVAYDAVSADLLDGEVMTLEQLLYCMMVGSANDAAAVIADHISGSQDAFVAEMNQYVQELGCTATVLTNAHGLHNDRQVTTARDMAVIVADAMKNEIFCEMFSAVDYTVPATNFSGERELSTNNFLINPNSYYYDARVTGGRTGTAQDGGRCIAASAEGNGLKVISIIMGSKSVYEDDGVTVRSQGGFNEVKALLDIGLSGYKAVKILYPGQALKQMEVFNGSSNVTLTPMDAVSSIIPVNAALEDLRFQYDHVGISDQAPIEKDQVMGEVVVYYNGLCVAKSTVVAMNTVALKVLQTPIQEDDSGIFGIVGIVLLCSGIVVAAAFLLRKGIRFYLKKAANARTKQYRRSRRRSR